VVYDVLAKGARVMTQALSSPGHQVAINLRDDFLNMLGMVDFELQFLRIVRNGFCLHDCCIRPGNLCIPGGRTSQENGRNGCRNREPSLSLAQ